MAEYSPTYFELSWAILSTICLVNVCFGFMILGVTGYCRIAVVPIVASAAGALANGLCYVSWYSNYPLHWKIIAAALSDAAWLVEEAGLPFYGYIILTRILPSPHLLIFRAMFWALILTLCAIKVPILLYRVRYLLGPSNDLLHRINYLHIGYFSGTAIIECLSAAFLLKNFYFAWRSSEDASLGGKLFKYLLCSTEIRVSVLALIGITRTVTFTFQLTTQRATTLSGQFDRFMFTLENLFPVVMYIDILAARLISAQRARTNCTGVAAGLQCCQASESIV